MPENRERTHVGLLASREDIQQADKNTCGCCFFPELIFEYACIHARQVAAILKQQKVMLKVELHTHTSDDPVDRIPYTAFQLIDRAATLQYDALAITLHDKRLDIEPLQGYAADRGIVLIPGTERSIHGRHVLLLNVGDDAEEVRTFEDIAGLKDRERGLVIAPHPYYPLTSCLGAYLDKHRDIFDAVEYNGMYTASLNFNRRAERWAVAPIFGG